jgi:tetratricopeptide (TPR) repeat protein
MHFSDQCGSGCLAAAGRTKRRWFFLAFWLAGTLALAAADLTETRKSFQQGKYREVISVAEEAAKERWSDEEWQHLLIESLLNTGKYPEALDATRLALRSNPWSFRLRLLAYHVYLQNGQKEQAAAMLDEINSMSGMRRRGGFQDAASIVALGRAALLLGADPKQVLDNLFERAKKLDPKSRDVYLASGQLALEKQDAPLAEKMFSEGLKHFPDDADFHYGLARAYATGDRGAMMEELDSALETNPNHVPSRLLIADHLIDAEDYDEAKEELNKALEVNPWHPEAHAYIAVLAHLDNDAKAEAEAREKGLKFWETNPKVDHLIGRKLSQKYRFSEGADCQRRALASDPDYIPAQIQLAQDLLRLGDEKDGWKLAKAVHDKDGYDVVAYNLVNLHDTIDQFATRTNEHFVLRMSKPEAAVYGDEALALLERARETLCRKYAVELDRPTVVEIFPNQKDFGVRTFGMPHNPGFLGVCFGPVVTANSPASQGASPANWQAVLWHEFCHVITLQMSRNKMPRWLSEGISVYEELQENAIWGQSMTPEYREMILGDDFTPLGKLSSAFLTPKSDRHLQFAYYESMLAVDFLIQRFGIEALRTVLADLAKGTEINTALAAHTVEIKKLETDFEEFAHKKVEGLAPKLDWEKPDREALAKKDWFEGKTNNFYALTFQARKLVREKKFAEAKKPLQTLIDFFPRHIGKDSPYPLLADIHRTLNETNEEKQVLQKLVDLDADAADSLLRLMELQAADKEWSAVATNALRLLAINPLLPQPHRFRAQANEALDRPEEAIAGYRKLLLLDPPDPADAHFRLARLLFQARDPEAKRHVLKALEEAPRFREALHLLLEINRALKDETKNSAPDLRVAGGTR